MADATLHLKGRFEAVVKTALVKYLATLDALVKTERSAGAATVDTDELIQMTKDLLNQLGYIPETIVKKGSAEVTRVDPAQMSLIDTAGAADAVKPEPEPRVFQVECLDCKEKFQARGTSATCPKCGSVFGILADEFGEVVRLTRGKARKAPPE